MDIARVPGNLFGIEVLGDPWDDLGAQLDNFVLSSLPLRPAVVSTFATGSEG